MSTHKRPPTKISTLGIPPPTPSLPQVSSPSSQLTPLPKAVFAPFIPARETSKPEEEDVSRLEPDEMFRRFTVGEVRGLQARLRAEADAKQEELRLMVGERYRDLLQASSSIVSISETSQRVVSALEEVKEACDTSSEVQTLQKSSNTRKRPMSIGGGLLLSRAGKQHADESQLATLQTLAAHLKLLLDTPEQLWRLLERKKHLQAAWLFLLARVVYRALIREDDEDDDGEESEVQWEKEGIRVTQQFPLAQRQWDTVSQFRSQISHRASQSLREPPSPSHATSARQPLSQATAETLFSIILLDSLSLEDTLSLFLSQRTKTLQSLYSKLQALPAFSTNQPLGRSPSINSPGIFKSRRRNRAAAATMLRSPGGSPKLGSSPLLSGDVSIGMDDSKRKRESLLKEVRHSLRHVLELLASTVGSVRDIFGDEESEKTPLLGDLLGHMQTDHSTLGPPNSLLSPSSARPNTQPSFPSATAVDQLTTKQILSLLPSSTLLLRFLPTTIQTYTPYIDTTTPSSQLSLLNVKSVVGAWYQTSLSELEIKLSSWLDVLTTIREVWSVWIGLLHVMTPSTSTPRWVGQLNTVERQRVLNLVKNVCTGRVREIWKERLFEIEGSVVKELQRCIETIKEEGPASKEDVEPVGFKFSSDYLSSTSRVSGISRNDPIGSRASFPTASVTLKKYQAGLKQRVLNRTPLLQSLVKLVEQFAQDLREDLTWLAGPSGQTKETFADLLKEYQPMAKASLMEITKSFTGTLSRETSDANAASSVNVAVFIGRVALDLAYESSFAATLTIREDQPYTLFCEEMRRIHELSLDCWRIRAVGQAVTIFVKADPIEGFTSSIPALPSYPSTKLAQALMHLVSALNKLGASKHANATGIAKTLLGSFAGEVGGKVMSRIDENSLSTQDQILWDLSFLMELCGPEEAQSSYVVSLSAVTERLQEKILQDSSPKAVAQLATHITTTVSAQIPRIQLLLGPLVSSTVSVLSQLPSAIRTKGSGFIGSGMGDQDFKLAMNVAHPSSRFGLLMVQDV